MTLQRTKTTFIDKYFYTIDGVKKLFSCLASEARKYCILKNIFGVKMLCEKFEIELSIG